jgi:exopolysaccharide biosynthesis polyprenyl glycosylphosphotransferase
VPIHVEQRRDRVEPVVAQATRLRRLAVLLALGDSLILVLAVTAAWEFRLALDFVLPQADPGLSLSSAAGPQVVVAWLLVLLVRGAYTTRSLGAGTDEYRAVVGASLATAGAIGLVCYLGSLDLSRAFLLLTFLLGTPCLLLWRWGARQVMHRFRARGYLLHRVVAVGDLSGVAEVVHVLRRERSLGYEIVGVCVPGAHLAASLDVHLGVPVVGSVADTREACSRLAADTVLVARGAYDSSDELRQIAWDLQGSGIELIVVPSLTDIAGPRIQLRPVAGLPLIHLQEPQADEAGGLAKRLFDVVGALAALLLLAPAMAVVAAAIRLEDGGPLLFRQRRIGWRGEEFHCLKFRSMVTGADRREQTLRAADGHSGALWKSRSDPRVTRVGAFIRRYSLDELPQLLNVLRGDMSLVGPRPQQPWEVETYSDSTRRRLLVRPGMTGLWQVSGRSDLPFEEAVRLDLYYVDNWSLTTDLVIMAKTAKAVVASGGAY